MTVIQPDSQHSWLCRTCGASGVEGIPPERCRKCGRPSPLSHPELHQLAIAHVDCDAFYATVEKRDDPSLRDRPVIVGGGERGVVSAACYIARTRGVRSAMPMFKARRLCPDAVIIRPNMRKYSAVSKEIHNLMAQLTPLIEPISLDEAFLDLSGTERLHGKSPVELLVGLQSRVLRDVGVTVSIGLSYCKFLAKIASDLEKPRGFAVIGRSDAIDFLSSRPVSLIWGVGKALQSRLDRDGIKTIKQLRSYSIDHLVGHYGSMGRRLYYFARGQDDRQVDPHRPTKSISAETTFSVDLSSVPELDHHLWRLSETVSARLKRADLAGSRVTLKLKTSAFKTITRNRTLSNATQLADVIFREGHALLSEVPTGEAFRLIGIGVSQLQSADAADQPDLLNPDLAKRGRVERAMDSVREKLGSSAISKGRSRPIGN